jgi:hypothetical protein
MRSRIFLTIIVIVSLFAVSSYAQVNVAAPGESGFGVGAAAAFTADGSAFGMQLSGTSAGIADLGISLRRETPDGGNAYWVKGISLDIVPLRTRHQRVRWSLGGTFSYEFTNIKYNTYFYDPYYGGSPGSSSRSVEVLSLGGLLFADVDVSAKTYVQFAGQVAHADYNGSAPSVTFYTFGTGLVTRQDNNTKVGFLASATIPSEGDYWTFGVQVNLFFNQHKERRI